MFWNCKLHIFFLLHQQVVHTQHTTMSVFFVAFTTYKKLCVWIKHVCISMQLFNNNCWGESCFQLLDCFISPCGVWIDFNSQRQVQTQVYWGQLTVWSYVDEVSLSMPDKQLLRNLHFGLGLNAWFIVLALVLIDIFITLHNEIIWHIFY